MALLAHNKHRVIYSYIPKYRQFTEHETKKRPT